MQKLVLRASQRDEAAIQRWREEWWPALKKTVKAEDASERSGSTRHMLFDVVEQ